MKIIKTLLVMLLFCPAAFAAEEEKVFTISEISISAPLVEIDTETLLEPLNIKAGDQVTFEQIEAARHTLMGRDIFAHVDATLTNLGDGKASVHFDAVSRLSVYRVVFFGFDALTREELLRKANLRHGMAFDPSAILKAKERIIEAYEEEGFFSPDIKVAFSQRSDLPFVIVKFRINEGTRSRVRAVHIEGILPVDATNISTAFPEYAVGLDASEQTLEDLELTLLRMLRREGYLEAYVRLNRMVYDPDSSDVIISFSIEPRDPISIQFSGNNIASDSELIELLKMDSRKVPFGPNAIPNLVRLIHRYYQQYGYYYAQVEYRELENSGPRRKFQISIDEGKRYQIGKVKFKGNKQVASSELKEHIFTKQRSFGLLSFWRSQHLVDEVFNEDAFRLEEFYHSKGFSQARVSALPPKLNSNEELEASFNIIEGERSMVRAVEIQWKELARTSKSIDEAALLMQIGTDFPKNTAYEIERAKKESSRLRNAVINLGYPNAEVSQYYNSKTQTLRFVIFPQTRVTIGRVVAKGSRIVPDWVVLREVDFKTGDRWDAETIRDNEASLFELGVFQSARIYAEDGKLDEEIEDLAVEVTDRDTGSIGASLTYNTDEGIGVSGELSQRNLYSRAQALDFTVIGNIRSGQQFLDSARMQLTFTEPRLFSTHTRFIAEGFFQKEIEFLNDYSRDRVGGLANVSYEFFEDLRVSAGVKAFYEDVYDVPADIVIGKDDEGSVFYSLATAQISLDGRDDRFNPREGYQAALISQAALDELGSEVSFGSLKAKAAIYVPITPSFTWANYLTYQIQEPFGDTDIVPLSHRLLLGGRTSLRGFATNSIGPRGFEGNVAGGDRSLQINSEFLIDFTDSFVILLFLDAGNAILNNKGTFTENPGSFSSLRYSPGVGLRYRTPIGPLGLDIGIPINQRSYEHPFRVNFNIGGHF